MRIMRIIGITLTIGIVGFCASLFLLPGAEVGAQQDRGWKVFVKTEPCAGRIDWVTVAKENPTGKGGLSYWESADLIISGNSMRCVRNIDQTCTKAEAEAEATIVRAQPQFTSYCCKDYSVWSNPQTGKMKIVVGKFSTGGEGWLFEDGPMCCFEAEAMTGITGACGSGGTHGGGNQGDGNQGGGTGFGSTIGGSLTGTNLTFYRGTTPEQCQADCGANPQCKGFTLIKAGAYSPNDPPMCYLASAVTGSSNSSCCISGIKGGGSGAGTMDLSGTWIVTTYVPTANGPDTLTFRIVLQTIGSAQWKGTLAFLRSSKGTVKWNGNPLTFQHLGGGRIRVVDAVGRAVEGTCDGSSFSVEGGVTTGVRQ